MKSIQKQVNKKAWKSIQAIKTSTNMIDVNIHINNAIMDTFSLRNMGLSKIEAINNGTLKEWEECKERNKKLMREQKEIVKSYLLTFVPTNLKNCRMYKKAAM